MKRNLLVTIHQGNGHTTSREKSTLKGTGVDQEAKREGGKSLIVERNR